MRVTLQGMDIRDALNRAMRSGFGHMAGRCQPGNLLGLEADCLSYFLHEQVFKGDLLKHVNCLEAEVLHDGLSLIVDTDAGPDFCCLDGMLNLDDMVSRMYLACYRNFPEPELRLLSSSSLFELLPAHRDYFVGKGLNRLCDLSTEKMCGPDVKPLTLEEVKNCQDMSGMTSACDFSLDDLYCGDPVCFSDFAWIKDGVALLYFHMSCGEMRRAWLYPFVTDAYSHRRH